ncbi:fimbria/pilus outer membrane usher protein [Erwinia piriflorinigrans]|uniref:Outer membrane usher protein fimD n=1 Tax=Erwinia piriflorinigrans CFBP 5888 TaxID=1161919 RepID=V5ZC86_9GAMM|nr:fimbria/pilus outer membrane usher protein [Erwinia piriflorinigrans]CCG88531.1 Outer membrane usher protein fimD [Erwinia piriflorinigrans CFBP 5888]
MSRLPHAKRRVPTCNISLLLSCILFALNASAQSDGGLVQFDLAMLQSRGVDEKVSSAFSETPRFIAGPTTVVLSVNGADRGRIRANFGEAGQLCVDDDFIRQAGLVRPEKSQNTGICTAPDALWPQAEVTADPGLNSLILVVPEQFLVASDDPANRNWSHGGQAALINYDTQYMTSSGRGMKTEYIQLNSEAGYNVADWIIRSRQQVSRLNGDDRIDRQGVWAQRTWAAARKVMQAGQINMSNAGQVLGVQFFPENALMQQDKGPALVEGIAETQSVVEVRQAQVLLYSTTVPAGPFSLRGFRLLNTRTDLQVKVTGSGEIVREFTVPASAFLRGNLSTPGLSFGVGRPDQSGIASKPLLATVSGGIALGKTTMLNTSLLASSPYMMASFDLDTQVFRPWMLTVQSTFSREDRHSKQGMQAGVELTWSPTERLSLGANARLQSTGYRELYDALQKEPREIRGMSHIQSGLSLGWDARSMGSLSFSVGRSSNYGGGSADYVRGAWSKSFGNVMVSASLARSTRQDGTGSDNVFYLTTSIPLDRGRLSSYINEGNGQTRSGLRWSERFGQDRGYSLAAEREMRSGQRRGTATADMVTPVSQLSGSLSGGDKSSTTLTARASGAIVAHANGVTTSPYQIGDTFGIVRVGDERSVKIDTPAGPTWTDGRGYAVIPGLNGFRKSVVQVDTRSLKKNVDIANAWQQTEAARGAVTEVEFAVVRTRRILATIRNATGDTIPHGASVFNASGTFITMSGENGTVFVPDAAVHDKYDVQVSGKTLCSFSLKLPEKAVQDVLYETADSVCS